MAARPADDDHPYGHHKAEYFSSGFEGILIIVAALGIGWLAVNRLLSPAPIEEVGWGLALSVASSALNGALAWLMLQSARAHRSKALEADARHLLTDVWTTGGVIVGVGAVALTGWWWLDPVVAIAVALNIVKEGVHLMWESSQGLMDEAVEPEVQAQIQEVLDGFTHEPDGRSILRFDHVVTRKAGQRRFVDLHMHMPAHWSLGRAAALRASVEQALMAEVPDPNDPSTQLNTGFIQDLMRADKTFLMGEAGSHCLRSGVLHLVDNWGTQSLDKLVLVKDGMSPVSGFEAQQDAFLVDMQKLGLQVCTCDDMAAELVANGKR